MEFILYCVDRPNRATLRSTLRVPHLAHISQRRHVFRFGGPLLDDAGRPRGSLMILDLPDRAALQVHMESDPFFSADLFESVTVWATRQVIPEVQPGGLERELAAAVLTAAEAINADSGMKSATRLQPTPLLKVAGGQAP